MRVRYKSNNSGGNWWLSDDDWRNLEKAGWAVEWVSARDDGLMKGRERWLGALATTATVEAESVEQAIEKWRSVTGHDPDAVGCPCCGYPHYFSEYC